MELAEQQGRWRILTLLFCVNLLNYIDRYVLSGVLPLVKEAFPGISHQKLGTLAPAFLIVYMVTSPLFGQLGDRYPRRILIGLGVQLWSLATAAAGLARSFWQLFLSRMFVGVGEAAYGTTAPTVISDLFDRRMRGRALSLFYVAIPVGSALGYLLGGLIGQAWSWRAAFWAVGLPGLLVGLAVYFIREPTRGGTEGVDATTLQRFLSRRIGWRQYLGPLRIRSFLFNTLGMTCFTYSIGGISYWMPLFLTEERHLPVDQANLWFGLVTVATGIAGTLAGGFLADRLARRLPGAYFLVCGTTMLLAAPGLYLALLSQDPTVYWLALAWAELMLFFNTGPSNTILVNVTLPNVRTTAFALNIFIIHALGDVLSPVVMGAIADRSGLTEAFLSTGGVVVLSGLVWLGGTPFLRRDMRRVREEMQRGDALG